MHYRIAEYRGRNRKISLVVQHFEVKGKEVCFACLSDRDDWAEALYRWFRGELLGKSLGVIGKKSGVVWKKLRKQLELIQSESFPPDVKLPCALAGILCVGEEFLGFERGSMRIYYLNTAFGRGHLELLEDRQDGDAQELFCFEGDLQTDVALLLMEELPAEKERMFSEGLFVGEMSGEWRMQSHLWELMGEIWKKGNTETGAILLRSCSAEEKDDRGRFAQEHSSEKRKGEEDAVGQLHAKVDEQANGFPRALVWEKLLGEGAFSQVYRVKDLQSGMQYACKKSAQVTMLWREFSLGRKLEHPLFPKMYHFWQEEGVGYLLMEYVPGCTVEELIQRRGALTAKQVVRLGIELADGLRYLHQWREPYLFRDMKPENVVIRQDGRVKLLDLGCAEKRGGRAVSKAGTPGYGAPEQFVFGKVLNETCDVYGLGRTMEVMLGTGRRGRKRRYGEGCLPGQKQRRQESKLRGAVKAICNQCTAEEPSCRIPDMEILLLLLAQLWENIGENLNDRYQQKNKISYGKDTKCFKNIWERNMEKY